MTAKAESAIFWPGITRDIHQLRATCFTCNRMAPSQASQPPTPPAPSEYPFQCVCSDYFHYKGHAYLVIVDRYTNWPATNGSKGLIDVLRRTFATYGIPDELASDGGPEFTAHDTQRFLQDWRVHHRRIPTRQLPCRDSGQDNKTPHLRQRENRSTSTPFSVQYCNTETHQILPPSNLPRHAYSAAPPRT